MFHKDFPRILVKACTKCSGALREQIDPGEWMCINCGSLLLDKPVDLSHIKYNASGTIKHSVEPILPIPPSEEIDEEPEETSPVQSLEEAVEEEQEGDDQEWNKLVTFHKDRMEDITPGQLPKT